MIIELIISGVLGGVIVLVGVAILLAASERGWPIPGFVAGIVVALLILIVLELLLR